MRACRWLLALVVLLVGLNATGCSTGHTVTIGHRTASGTMMGRGFGGSMMGTVPHRYHLSRLTCAAPRSLPGTTVHVLLGDMGMTHVMRGIASVGSRMILRAVPATVPAGRVSFVVANLGWRTHELVVLPLASGRAAGQRVPGTDGRVDETGSRGEASSSCAAGAGDGIDAGTVGWVTLTLPRGRYELACNRRNHYVDGMHQLLVVT